MPKGCMTGSGRRQRCTPASVCEHGRQWHLMYSSVTTQPYIKPAARPAATTNQAKGLRICTNGRGGHTHRDGLPARNDVTQRKEEQATMSVCSHDLTTDDQIDIMPMLILNYEHMLSHRQSTWLHTYIDIPRLDHPQGQNH